jgi:hypothetical protein
MESVERIERQRAGGVAASAARRAAQHVDRHRLAGHRRAPGWRARQSGRAVVAGADPAAVAGLAGHRLVAQPAAARAQGPPDGEQTRFLRAHRAPHLGFFDTFVGADDHWLPPDNYQEYRVAAVAHRTSPTNMGLALLANLAPTISATSRPGKLLERTANTLDTMAGLERHRGHFYNWYDTQTLQPLPPLYVSTVDSGNLAGHLLTLRAGLLALADEPILPPGLRLPVRQDAPPAGIGYNVDERRLDASYYDLLASEARLCSFVAIAQASCRRKAGSRSAACSPAPAASHPAVVERLDVRVPDAAAGDADLRQHPARPDLRGAVARQIAYGSSAACPGASRNPATTPSTCSSTTSTAPSACRAWAQARPGRGPGDRALCQHAGADGGAGGPARTCSGWPPRASGALRLLRGDRLHAGAPAARAVAAPWCAPSWPTTRA